MLAYEFLRTGEPNMPVAGIDVSVRTVTLDINPAGQTGKPREYKNTPPDHAALIKRLLAIQALHRTHAPFDGGRFYPPANTAA